MSDVTFEAHLSEQRLTLHLNGQGRRFSFVPNRVVVEDESGRVFSERADPRAAFCGHTAGSLCDWPIAKGRTCDKPCCYRCLRHVGKDVDYCRDHWDIMSAEPTPAQGELFA